MSIKFPVEEKHSLTDKIRRLSRSACTNLAEAYRKEFILNIVFQTQRQEYCKLNSEVGKLLTYMFNNPDLE